jgi:tRNA A-37 threonylcarbamoyl transferase component Bud32
VSIPEGALVGPYRLGRLLGRGGMARVYEATHESLGRTVALKLMSPELADPGFVERFRNEGRMQAALEHPNVVTVYEAGSSDHGPYLAMGLVRGTTLARLIDDGALDTARTLDIVGQVADALDAAHALGIVHRDVKPRNVLVDGDDHAYLADFGLTRQEGAAGATATGTFLGTLSYAAPEVLRGDPGGAAADRYALAAVLFECLTGTPVFPRPSQAAIVYAHTNEPPPRVSGRREGAPPAIDDVLIASLAKDPAARPPTCGSLVERAAAALAGHELGPAPRRVAAAVDETTTGESAAAPAASSPVSPRRRGVLPLAVTAVVAALAGAGAVAVLGGDGSPGPVAPIATPSGMQLLGSDLSGEGRTLDCRDRPPGSGSPSCTLVQDRLPGATLVVPRNGVVRRWGVRSASGELALAVLRRSDDGYFQVARSRNEFVGNDEVHLFGTDLVVEEGDRLAVQVVGDSGVGVRDGAGAATERWTPPLRGAVATSAPAVAGELLLRADYLPGGAPRTSPRLAGAPAAAAPAGTVLARRAGRFANGGAFEVRVVRVGSTGAVDLLRDGRRIGRVDVPMLGADVEEILALVVVVEPSSPEQLGIDLVFARPDSARLVRHYLAYSPADGLLLI